MCMCVCMCVCAPCIIHEGAVKVSRRGERGETGFLGRAWGVGCWADIEEYQKERGVLKGRLG
jgi:hypothetical protein